MRLLVFLSLIPSVMSECVGVFKISNGNDKYYAALMTDGTVQSNHAVTSNTNTVDFQPLTNVIDVTCGGYVCIAIFENRTAKVWGDKRVGGDIRFSNDDVTPLPDNVELTDVADISCDRYACVFRKNDGTAYAWGDTKRGGNAPTLTDVADISCGENACVARMNNGTAKVWGGNDGGAWGGDSEYVATLRDVADISCGRYACAARMENGDAVTWGRSGYGATDDTLTNVTNISCGGDVCFALKNNGDGVVWGNYGGNPGDNDLSDLADITCGDYQCAALTNNGNVLGWGIPSLGGTPPVGLTNVTHITCGSTSCSALMNNGDAIVWGQRPSSGTLTNVTYIECKGSGCSVLKSDDTAVVWGSTTTYSSTVPSAAPAGYFNNPDWKSAKYVPLEPPVELCLRCPLGTYQNETNKDSCETCPSGTSTTVPGSTLETECLTALEIKQKFVETQDPSLVPAYNIANSCG